MKKYLEAMRCEFKFHLNYRLNLFFGVSYHPIILLVYYFLWTFIYRAGGSIGDYSLGGMLTYYLITGLLGMFVPIFAYYTMTENIKKGDLIFFLTRPLDFLGYYYFAILTGCLIWSMSAIIVSLPFILWWRNILIFPCINGMLKGLIFTIIAFNMALTLGFILNLLTFFIGDPFGISGFYDFLISLLGGWVLPLDVLPGFIQYLPFKFLYYIPARAFMNYPISLTKELLTAMLWLVFFFAVIRFMWIMGIKKYEAFGG